MIDEDRERDWMHDPEQWKPVADPWEWEMPGNEFTVYGLPDETPGTFTITVEPLTGWRRIVSRLLRLVGR